MPLVPASCLKRKNPAPQRRVWLRHLSGTAVDGPGT